MLRNKLPQTVETALQLMHTKKVGDMIKTWEDTFDHHCVGPSSPFIVRVDGVSFSNYTRGMKKPFDDRMTQSMVKTTIDLTARFNATLGYHQSDEISLFFPAAMEQGSKIERVHIYSGRVQKLASVIASYASVRFNYHITNCNWSDVDKKTFEKINEHSAYFDGRVVPCKDNNAAMECIFWRSNFDGIRNAISHIAQEHITTKELHGQSIRKQLELLECRGIDVFNTYSNQILYGTWVKKEQYEMFGAMNLKTNLPVQVPVTRTRIRTGSFNWADWSAEARTEFLESKLWNDSHPPMHNI